MVTMHSAIFSSNLEPMSTQKEAMRKQRQYCGLASDAICRLFSCF